MIDAGDIIGRHLVLIVDDQEINRDSLEVTLEDDYDLLFAENGKEALDIIRERADELSIVLLDLMMPVMDGFEVMETMKDDEELKDIPIIVLTAEKNAELKALKMGAADFITKPFDMPEIIQARVERIIELSEGRQLISAAEHDKLTMLYSRNFFFEYANRLYTFHPEKHFDALVVNIEQFHSLNEIYGREFCDDVLRCIGNEIRAFLAEGDGIASRFEADRFYIYCCHYVDYEAVLARFQNKVNDMAAGVSIRLRMGVMLWHEDTEPILLFDRARTACNMIRGNFKQSVMVYDDDMHMRELLNLRLINDLNTAVEEKQLKVFYQPKYNIQAEPPVLASAEALVRWDHPELGMISPGVFIPLFEKNGLIGVVDNFVWDEAARQIAEWKKKFGWSMPVSVNLSRSDLFDPGLVDVFKGLVEKYGLEHNDLKLEITESAYTENAGHVLEVIAELKSLGFEIEMDDFGSGYSSLNMLSDMPINVLKMDMKFVRNIEHSETDMRLVSLILDIAKYIKVISVAEGVETQGQLDILKKGGCEVVQGYYFSRPLPAADYEDIIKKELAKEGER